MKKSRLSFYILLFISTHLSAQSSWQWGQEVRADAKHIAVDDLGNSYVTWSLQGSYTIDGDNFVSNGSSDIALTSFDCDGTHRWTKTVGGQGSDVASVVRTDTLGGVYLTGRFSAMGNYDVFISSDSIITGYTNKGFFLIKYDSGGEFQWFRMPEDTAFIDLTNIQLAGPLDMDVAPNGDCYIFSKLPAGTYGDAAYETTQEGEPNGGDNLHLLKYDSDGNCTGGIHLDMYYSGSILTAGKLSRDHYTGRFYMSGYISNEDNILILGGEEVTEANYVVQFDSAGFVNWRISTEDSGVDNTYFVGKPSVDELGNVYITGDSYNENSFGDFDFINTVGNSNFPIFAKIDSVGNVIFATNASVASVGKGKATAYVDNTVALTGDFLNQIVWGEFIDDPDNSQLNNIFITTFQSSGTGLPSSLDVLTGSVNGNEYSSLLTSDNQGNFYVGGKFSGQLEVGEGTLYNQSGPSEGFIAKFGTDSCYCPLPEALFTYDSIPNEPAYSFAYTGTASVDSVVWNFGDGEVGYGIDVQHVFAESGAYQVCATAYNSCGTDTLCATLNALGPVGVRAIKGFEEVKVYPNPAKDFILIDHTLTNARLNVLNAVGQKVLSSSLMSTSAQIDISPLTPGIYLLQIVDGDGKIGYARFVKD